MTLHSPLLPDHLARGAVTLAYPDPADPTRSAEVVEAFGPVELEYAALRRGCALFDLPQRATVHVRGPDRLDFLGRMLTQDVKSLALWRSCRSFWLSRKGRIEADLRVTSLEDHIRFDLDVHGAKRTIETLGGYLFAESVELADATESLHRLALHGPASALLVGAIGEPASGPGPEDLGDRQACAVRIAGRDVLVERDDQAGEIGLHLTCATEHVVEVYNALLEAGGDRGTEATHGTSPVARAGDLASRVRLRPAGWHAFNIARIEAGTPLYPIDFDGTNLPHETGVLHDRVSFKKGCYLGQEIVARMESLGQPRQKLVALRFDDEKNPDLPQPVTGSEVFAAGAEANPIGLVTSSTISPMLGSAPVCFAMVRIVASTPGFRLVVSAGSDRIHATVQPSLTLWSRNAATVAER